MADSALCASTAPFRLDWTAHNPFVQAVSTFAKPILARVLALEQLNHTHADIASRGEEESFSERALKSLSIKLDVDESALQAIPQTGPLVVVANHPFGGIDGLALLALIKRRRPDVKIVANDILKRVPELAADSFFVDPFGGSGTTLIAAEKTGRLARLIEFDPAYCDTILRRFERVTGKQATHSARDLSFEEVAQERAAPPTAAEK